MTIDGKLFAGVTAFYFVAGLSYPLTLAVKLRRHPHDASRWLKNTPTFTIYLPFFFAVAGGILFSSFPWAEVIDPSGPLRSLTAGVPALAVLFVLMFLAAFAALEDLKRPVVEPFMFKKHTRLLKLERSLRTKLKHAEIGDQERQKLVQGYLAKAKPLMTLSGLSARGSPCAFSSFFLNLLAAETTAFLFWYLGMAQVLDFSVKRTAVATFVGLFCLWFPFRLYTEWYLHFYSLGHLKRYWAFWFVLIAAALAYAFYCFGVGGLAEIFSLAVAGLIALVGILGKVRPEWLGFVADIIEEMPPRWFAACMSLVVIALILMALGTIG